MSSLDFLNDPLVCPPELNEQHLAMTQAISAEIASVGAIGFARFMELALYHPRFGYYQSALRKFGAQGDFVTAPEISSLFSRCVAEQASQALRCIEQGSILELGAGSGIMAVDILKHLQAVQCLPDLYYILELSGDLRLRQQQRVAQEIPWFQDRVIWLDSLEGVHFQGVLLANEVLDAMPVQRFRKSAHKIFEMKVSVGANGFEWLESDADGVLSASIQELESSLESQLPDAYTSEINLLLHPWMQSIAACLDVGMLLLIDYGYPEREYYLPERTMGTLMCHFRHRAHGNPLILTGVQDITSYVDFSLVARTGHQAGLSLLGFTTQAHFLLSCGVEKLLPSFDDEQAYWEATRQLKILTLPGEMGERFKVMALGKNFDENLQGFSFADFSGRL